MLQGKRAGFGLVMDDVLSGADIDIYGLADATRRRANGMEKASTADRAILSRTDLSSAVRGRPDLKVSGMQPGNKALIFQQTFRCTSYTVYLDPPLGNSSVSSKSAFGRIEYPHTAT